MDGTDNKIAVLPKGEKMTNYLEKADIYRILSMGFSYPDDSSISELRSLISDLMECRPANQIKKYLKEILENSDVRILRKEYSRLFLKGSIPLHEGAYNLNLNIIPDVSAYYKAFGLSSLSGDTPDSLNYELQFLSLLSLKIYLAQNKEQEETSKDAYRKFLKEHLVNFIDGFINRLGKARGGTFYGSLSGLLHCFIINEIKTTFKASSPKS